MERELAWIRLFEGVDRTMLDTQPFRAELALPLLWSAGRRRGVGIADISTLLSG